MNPTAILTAAIAATLAATPALAVPPGGRQVASAELQRIRDWDAPNPDTLYVNAQNGKWYEARMADHCWQLPTTNRLKIDMASPGTLDSASTVSVEHEHCAIASLSGWTGSAIPCANSARGRLPTEISTDLLAAVVDSAACRGTTAVSNRSHPVLQIFRDMEHGAPAGSNLPGLLLRGQLRRIRLRQLQAL